MLALPRSLTLLLAGGLLLGPAVEPAAAQERSVLSSRIAVSQDEATLGLEFADGGTLELGLRGERVLVDGSEVGRYEPGGTLDRAWRDLLSDAVMLDDGPLARALLEWSPPEAASDAARRLDSALESALRTSDAPAVDAAPAGEAAGDDAARLLRRASRLPGLAAALEGLALRSVDLRVGEDVEIPAGERVEGTLVVVDGDLTLGGEVSGDVVVTGGTLRLADGGRIGGETRLLDAELDNRGGSVAGAVRTIPSAAAGADPSSRERLESQLEERIRRDIRAEFEDIRGRTIDTRRERESGFGHWLSHVGDAVGGMIQTGVTFLFLGLVGLGVVRFAPDNLYAVSDAVRRSPARSAAVGAAGVVLLIPAWILGMAALAITIVGLVALPFWIVLFPFAAVVAAGLGYLAVARNVGQWVVEQRVGWLEGLELRASNAVHTLLTGLAVLLGLFLVGHALEVFGGFLDFLQALVVGTATLATLVAVVTGFGAVLLTRGGRRPDLGGDDLFGEALWPTDPTGGRGPSGEASPGGPDAPHGTGPSGAGGRGAAGASGAAEASDAARTAGGTPPAEPGYGDTGTRAGAPSEGWTAEGAPEASDASDEEPDSEVDDSGREE